MITREFLEARIVVLTAARDKHQADVAGNNGAIQLCRQLLATLAAEPDPAKVVEQDETVPAAANGEATQP